MSVDVVLIVDQYQRHLEATKRGYKIDPVREAKGLSTLVKPLGFDTKRIAIVSQEDEEGLTAYHRNGFEVTTVNGNRQTELFGFIQHMNQTLTKDPPGYLVLVSTDPTFAFLCEQVAHMDKIQLAVWAPAATTPPELTHPDYNYRQLEDLLPDIKIPTVDVRLDYENLHIGLEKKGWPPNPKTLINAVKAEIADLGEVVSIVAYADWGALSKDSKHDLQRELALIGVETRYQVNMHGKNSADMKIADDIRTLVEKDTGAPDAVDIIVLGTCDRDFRPTVETAKARSRQLVVLALEGGLSGELRKVAGEIRYLDAHLPLARSTRGPRGAAPTPKPSDEHADLIVRIVAWLRRQGWKWAYADRLAAAVAPGPAGAERLRRAVNADLLCRRSRQTSHGQAETLMPDLKHPLVQTAQHLVEWAPARVSYCLESKGMPYIDSHFLAKGMTMDATFRRLGAGQNRSEAEGWLELVVGAGLLVKRSQPHPKSPGNSITTWWLPERADNLALMVPWLITCADSQMARYNRNWVPIRTLHHKLGSLHQGAFQQALDQLLTNGEARKEKHTPAGRQHPVTGLYLESDGPTVTSVRAERQRLLQHLQALDEAGEPITLDALTERLAAEPKLDPEAIQHWLSGPGRPPTPGPRRCLFSPSAHRHELGPPVHRLEPAVGRACCRYSVKPLAGQLGVAGAEGSLSSRADKPGLPG